MRKTLQLPPELQGLDRPLLFRCKVDEFTGPSVYHWEEIESGVVCSRKLLRRLESLGEVTIEALRPGNAKDPSWVVHEVESEEMQP